jgi:hypothetical protein
MQKSLILNGLNKDSITLVSLYWYTMMHGQQNIMVNNIFNFRILFVNVANLYTIFYILRGFTKEYYISQQMN